MNTSVARCIRQVLLPPIGIANVGSVRQVQSLPAGAEEGYRRRGPASWHHCRGHDLDQVKCFGVPCWSEAIARVGPMQHAAPALCGRWVVIVKPGEAVQRGAELDQKDFSYWWNQIAVRLAAGRPRLTTIHIS